MTESIRTIKFERFRGLPQSEVILKGKNLVLLGTNGKGKSAFVDGIEFLFSGKVARFSGIGTGAINHDEAVRHVNSSEAPKVAFSLIPSSGEISRELGAESPDHTDHESVEEFARIHSNVDSFILRRARILEFVNDQDADRYRKFVRLLGISKVDSLQRSFNTAAIDTENAFTSAKSERAVKLATFNDPEIGFTPANLEEIFAKVSESVESFEYEKPESWIGVSTNLEDLKKKRPETNRKIIDGITRALVSIETLLPTTVSADIATANDLRRKVIEIEKASPEAPRSTVISDGVSYLENHPDDDTCPLCEKKFEAPAVDVLARLTERREALRGISLIRSTRRGAITRIMAFASGVAERLKLDLQHAEYFDEESRIKLRGVRAQALLWTRRIRYLEKERDDIDHEIPIDLESTVDTRNHIADTIRLKKHSLIPPDSSNLEKAILLLEKWIAAFEEIDEIEKSLINLERHSKRTLIAKSAFSKARETAIQVVFNKIADNVLQYYNQLHNLEATGDSSECTKLELKATTRAASGGLRLAIEFLGIGGSKDPRGFLSEGHLDSLGLCIFLATVKIFNPPGSLLVLDDVLTSIDKEHRHRFGELLLSEFSDYKIILTTHDEYWHDQLDSLANARGVRRQWSFQKLESWNIDEGPSFNEVSSSWEFIDSHLNETDYRELGGAFRSVFEDFLKRTAAKMQLEVKFKYEGKYTSGDFMTAGTHGKVRDKLIRLHQDEEDSIRNEFGRVFGQGELINFLSHNNQSRFEITYSQAQDFVQGLKDITLRCEESGLIKNR